MLHAPASSSTLKSTVPVGVDGVPVSVSASVTVHVVGLPTATEPGKQLMVVVVARPPVRTSVGVLEARWSASPRYDTVRITTPGAAAVKDRLHDAADGVPETGASVQLVPASVPDPVGTEKLAGPVGVTGDPDPVSVTVAVQVAAWPSPTMIGAQLASSVMGRGATVTTVVDAELAVWLESPR